MRKILRSPIVKGVARWANKQPFIWDGIYESFDQAPVIGHGFASDAWLSDMERYTRSAVAAIGNAKIPENVPQYHALLASLVASFDSNTDRPVRVLDFGGGMGIGFANLIRCAAAKSHVEYLVVDNEPSCARGRQLLQDFPSVTFTTRLTTEPAAVDIVVLSGVLQFVEDYEELLTNLARFKPTLWLFTFLPAGDIPTFVSAQRNVPGSILPVWFFNLGELVENLDALGYKLVFKSALDRVFDMSNFPPAHQLHRQCNLLFRRQ
ncbi:MAG TPA: methyltransferase, TIGR04325 family [Pyrinomonadaceae bacterium]|nr:methyltransferase, TIGR04325 family [Pyrinomonadaceae bacterium]